jgi:flagellar assembly protein FliH
MSSNVRSASGVTILPEPFDYPHTNGSSQMSDTGEARQHDASTRFSSEQRENEAFERGLAQGEARARVSTETQITQLRLSLGSCLEAFKKERESYFGRVESEVVRLALAIAKKILHREAQMDPLLLAGMVHVALEKFDSGTTLRLRTRPEEIRFWQAHFLQHGSPHRVPELMGDSTLGPGECALETEVGSTHVSLSAQLKEIEQGFFDLLEHRPVVR